VRSLRGDSAKTESKRGKDFYEDRFPPIRVGEGVPSIVTAVEQGKEGREPLSGYREERPSDIGKERDLKNFEQIFLRSLKKNGRTVTT